MRLRSWPVFCLSALLLPIGLSHAAVFEDEVERDFAVRSIGQLQITNLRGGITVKGWAQDKIRVNAKRKVQAESADEAKQFFDALDFRYQTSGKDIELSAQYGGGRDIHQRLRERQNPRTSMDMVVLAPANFHLRVWAVDGAVAVTGWNGPLEVRTAKGKIEISDMGSPNASLLCPYCPIRASKIRGSLRCMGGTGNVVVEDAQGDQLFVETSSGNQKLDRIVAQQLYISKSGRIEGRALKGKIEFHSTEGDVEILDASGFASGNTSSGNVRIQMKDWRFEDRALIESVQGSVSVQLPATFSGEVDARSVAGKAKVDFKLKSQYNPNLIGPQPANHFRGKVGESDEQLKLFSRDGDVHLLKGP